MRVCERAHDSDRVERPAPTSTASSPTQAFKPRDSEFLSRGPPQRRVLAITLYPGVSLLCSMPIAVGLEKGYPVEKRARPARRVKGVRQLLRSASLPTAQSGDLKSSPWVSRLRAA